MSMKLELAVLFGAAVMGVGAGAVMHWSEEPPPAPPPTFKPRIVLPYASDTAADAEWRSRGDYPLAPAVPYGRGSAAPQISGLERPVTSSTPYVLGDQGSAARARDRQNARPGDRKVKVPLL